MKPLGSTVAPAPAATPSATPGAERALPPTLPGGWRLSGGPADYTPETAAGALGEEAGRFRTLKSYASAEYANHANRVIAVEVFEMGSTEAAANALAIGKPEKADPLAGEEADEGFVTGLRAEARKGPVLVRVRWFEDDDVLLEDAAVEALKDVVEIAWKEGLTTPKHPSAPSPAASPTASPAASPQPGSTPAPAGQIQP